MLSHFYSEHCDGATAAYHNCDAVIPGSSERRAKNLTIMMEFKSWPLISKEVLGDLQEVLEEWSGVQLLPSQA